jgi:hypothetical protein
VSNLKQLPEQSAVSQPCKHPKNPSIQLITVKASALHAHATLGLQTAQHPCIIYPGLQLSEQPAGSQSTLQSSPCLSQHSTLQSKQHSCMHVPHQHCTLLVTLSYTWPRKDHAVSSTPPSHTNTVLLLCCSCCCHQVRHLGWFCLRPRCHRSQPLGPWQLVGQEVRWNLLPTTFDYR